MTARHAQVKKKNITNTGMKSNKEMPALKIRALTIKYSYVPELSNIFHPGRKRQLYSPTLRCSALKYFCCQQDHQKQLDKQEQEQ